MAEMVGSNRTPAPDRVDILLVEDNPLDARATFKAAQKLNLASRIQVISDGQAALDLLRRNRAAGSVPRLVLLDLSMPGKDGHDVLAEIRADTDLRAVPVVVLSTSDDDSDIERAYNLGANAYITKPTGLDEWFRVISSINDFWLSIAKLPR